MTTADRILSQGVDLLLEDFGEEVDYCGVDVSGALPPKRLKAVLYEGDIIRSEDLGSSTPSTPEPIVFVISKDPTTGIDHVAEGEDRIVRWPGTPQERRYLVQMALSTNEPEWRLYATP